MKRLNNKSYNRANIFIIGAILLFTGVSYCLQGMNYMPVDDDICYEYVLGEKVVGSRDNPYDQKIESFSDIVQSQINHYKGSNGRTIVHIIVQIFTGLIGMRGFAIFVSVLLLSVIVLFIYYTIPERHRSNPLIWLFTCILFVYLYPSPIGSFYRIVFGCNYLYPMFLLLLYFIAIRKCRQYVKHTGWLTLMGLFLLGFVTGWSHEGFIVPLCGATFIYAICNHRMLIKPIWILFLSLWIGGCFLVLCPANFNKVSSDMIITIFNGLNIYINLRLFWLAIAIFILAIIRDKRMTTDILRQHPILSISFAISMVFGLIANTGTWSLNGMQFFASLLMYFLLPVAFSGITKYRKTLALFGVIAFTVYVVHQIDIIRISQKVYQDQLRLISDYKKSPNGIVYYKYFDLKWFESPYVQYWGTGERSLLVPYYEFSLGLKHLGGEKPMTIFSETDYRPINDPDAFFINKNKLPGNSGIYDGDKFFWAKERDFDFSKNYEMDYYPPELKDSPYLLITLKILLQPDSFVSSEMINKNDTVSYTASDGEKVIRLPKPTWRKVKYIHKIP